MVQDIAQREAVDLVRVDRYTDIVGPSNEMLGPVRMAGGSNSSRCRVAGGR